VEFRVLMVVGSAGGVPGSGRAMSEHRSAPPAAGTAAAGTGYRAVQQDVAVTVVDWPAVHAWSEGDTDFVGAVTVTAGAGGLPATVDWPVPGDESADSSLGGMRWRRVGPWERDRLGRRVAPVAPIPVLPRQGGPITGTVIVGGDT
jgi:hypothetical protein